MMKRFFSLILALLMLAVPAYAEEAHEAHVLAVEDSGIELTMHDDWFHDLAYNLYAKHDRSTADPCEYSDLFFLYQNEDIPETAEGMFLFALSNRIVGSEHVPVMPGHDAPAESAVLLTENGRELLIWHNDPATFPAEVADTLMLPIDRLLNNPGDVAISEPIPMPIAAGFDAITGLNAVDLTPVAADVLAGKKLTMINIWATYCNPCIEEMPYLAQLNHDYADQGFQIIGMLTDVGAAGDYDEETLLYGQAIIQQTGADYLHIVPGEGMFYGALNGITAVPTTYFVDETGAIVGEPYVGGRSYDQWAAIVEDLLAQLP